MRKLLVLPLLLLFFGCARNHFNVPADNFASRVKVLGVAPIFIDGDSDIKHPQKEQLIALVSEANHAHEYQLVRKLKETGSYYSVSLLDGDPRSIFPALFFRREKRDDASIQYNKYFWKNEELQKYIRKNNLDAIMLIVVSGLSKIDKVYSNTMLTSLTSEYNYLIMSAQVLDANGAVLWEYPNFRTRLPSYQPMIALQYPDFNEAEANISDKPEMKFKTIAGIKRRFSEKQKDLLRRETKDSEVYAAQFDEMVSLLKFDPAKEQKNAAVPEKARSAVEQPRPAVEPRVSPQTTPAASSAPLAETPTAPGVKPGGVKPLSVEVGGTSADVIVPATGPTN